MKIMSPDTADNKIIASVSIARWLLLMIIAAAIYFFHGFIIPVLAALVIGFASWPLFNKFTKLLKGRRTLAASIAVAFIVAFIIGPITLALTYAVTELGKVLNWVIKVNKLGSETPEWIANIPTVGQSLSEIWMSHLGKPGGFTEIGMIFGTHIGNVYSTVLAAGGTAFGLVLTLIFMLITLFFVYRNGQEIAEQVNIVGENILPKRWKRISGVCFHQRYSPALQSLDNFDKQKTR